MLDSIFFCLITLLSVGYSIL
ncbi:hypothetical protein [Clostridium acetobutylicum]